MLARSRGRESVHDGDDLLLSRLELVAVALEEIANARRVKVEAPRAAE
jgi:hypothetical protein